MTEEQISEKAYRPMQAVKRHFFAMRNGIIADTLRQAGSPFRFIFGLNIPQLAETAEMTGKNRDLAEELWANSTTRESMLLAPMLMPADSFSMDDALRWTSAIPAPEIADVLCHRLLRHLSYAPELAEELTSDPTDDMRCYTAGRLALNLFYSDAGIARKISQLLSACDGRFTKAICRQIGERLEEI